MVFSSLIFLYAFLPISLLVYIFCPNLKSKNMCLLTFSLFFYAWGEPKYVLLLVFMSFCSWVFARNIETTRGGKKAKIYLFLACAVDLTLIGIFKYSSLICAVFGEVPDFVANIALPIGISFYTFQLLTYVVDVYRGEGEAQESFLNVLLYASLFHQCIAGPIVRYQLIEQELYHKRSGTEGLLDGISRFSLGLAKKCLLANPCGAVADQLILSESIISDVTLLVSSASTLSSTSVLALWLGIIMYAFQIFFDFSAYSDMAIGMGLMLGFHYPENFNYPYISKSIGEFWRRWHMTLSSFFRDYVYIPLGGRRCSPMRNVFNLFVVWALTGLWHGASWNFVLWGLYFFVLLLIERLFLGEILKKVPAIIANFYTVFMVLISWTLFRYTQMSLGFEVLKGMFGLNGNALTDFTTLTILQNNVFLIIACLICSVPLFKIISNKIKIKAQNDEKLEKIRCIVSYVVLPICALLLSTAALVGDSYNPFIYFQF